VPDLVFIGPSGAGKSRVGKRVARLLDLPFTDTDKLIVADHGPIADIFARHGEPHFRVLERAAVRQGLQLPGVLSVGGGAVLDPDTQNDLDRYRVVLLTVSPEAVAGRLGGKRPLVRNGVADWIALNEPRREIYERLADVTVDTSHRPYDAIAEEVAEWARTPA
jgi:shikimate kinase